MWNLYAPKYKVAPRVWIWNLNRAPLIYSQASTRPGSLRTWQCLSKFWGRGKASSFIKMQQGRHITSHAWIMYEAQCDLLDCLITNIFQNVSVSFSSLRISIYRGKTITYLRTSWIAFCQIPMHTSNWYETRGTSSMHFFKIKNIAQKHSEELFQLATFTFTCKRCSYFPLQCKTTHTSQCKYNS